MRPARVEGRLLRLERREGRVSSPRSLFHPLSSLSTVSTPPSFPSLPSDTYFVMFTLHKIFSFPRGKLRQTMRGIPATSAALVALRRGPLFSFAARMSIDELSSTHHHHRTTQRADSRIHPLFICPTYLRFKLLLDGALFYGGISASQTVKHIRF